MQGRAPGPVAAPPPDASRWAAVDAELARLVGGVGLLGAATPRDPHVEHARLLADYSRGRERPPAWTYDVDRPLHALRLHALDALARQLRGVERTPLGALYRARIDEIRLELEAALAAGTPHFAERVRARYPASAEQERADALAARWCGEADAEVTAASLASDDPDPRSLVSRLRAEVARRRLPFTVRTSRSISALAAIGGDTLWVAEGRPLTAIDVERTVVHEIEAHALPRTRARALPIGIFAIGTARGNDDQEGYALWLEEARRVSGPGRRRELAARHRAVSQMRAGGDFVSVVRALRGSGVPLEASLRAAERAFRGSHGVQPGLGRERVYLEALVRVRHRLAALPGDERVLAAGQVAVDAIEVLRPWV